MKGTHDRRDRGERVRGKDRRETAMHLWWREDSKTQERGNAGERLKKEKFDSK
jgi:hypothetical protein